MFEASGRHPWLGLDVYAFLMRCEVGVCQTLQFDINAELESLPGRLTRVLHRRFWKVMGISCLRKASDIEFT